MKCERNDGGLALTAVIFETISVTAALTATPSSDLIMQVESFRDEQEVPLWYCRLQHSQAARRVGGKGS